MTTIKTKKEWDGIHSDLELDQYLQPMDEVDEELYLYCGEIVAPQYCSYYFLQMGEAEFEHKNVYYYSTFAHVGGRYYYLGKLPEFMQ
jgi:hypothetical protein